MKCALSFGTSSRAGGPEVTKALKKRKKKNPKNSQCLSCCNVSLLHLLVPLLKLDAQRDASNSMREDAKMQIRLSSRAGWHNSQCYYDAKPLDLIQQRWGSRAELRGEGELPRDVRKLENDTGFHHTRRMEVWLIQLLSSQMTLGGIKVIVGTMVCGGLTFSNTEIGHLQHHYFSLLCSNTFLPGENGVYT